jgi:hypothetical protein
MPQPSVKDLMPYVSTVLDTALSPDRRKSDIRPGAVLVGWQAGFEPHVLAVVGAYANEKVDPEEAADIAKDWLEETGWFSGEATDPDIVVSVHEKDVASLTHDYEELDEDEEDEDTSDITDALDAYADAEANRQACAALSTLGDQDMMDLEAAGYDPQSEYTLSGAGYEVAVGGDVTVHPLLAKELGLESVEPGEHRVLLWSEAGKRGRGDSFRRADDVLTEHLKGLGYKKVPRMGGAYPGGVEEEITVEFAVQAVARELGISKDRVQRVVEDHWDDAELVYRTSDTVHTVVYALKRKD